jgi:hypothetical protein
METILSGSYYGAITKNVTSFLCFNDVISLCFVNKTCNEFLKECCSQMFASKLRERFNRMSNIQYQQFQDLLIGHHAIISGSVILQIIYNETWKESDIDIFCNEENLNEFDVVFRHLGFYSYNQHNTYGNLPLTSIKYSKWGTCDINLICNQLYPSKNIKEVIYNTFDYDCLINTWDGKNLEIYNIDSIITRKLVLKNDPMCIYAKMLQVNVDVLKDHFDFYQKTVYRLKKYKERGFTYDHVSTYLDTIYKSPMDHVERMDMLDTNYNFDDDKNACDAYDQEMYIEYHGMGEDEYVFINNNITYNDHNRDAYDANEKKLRKEYRGD